MTAPTIEWETPVQTRRGPIDSILATHRDRVEEMTDMLLAHPGEWAVLYRYDTTKTKRGTVSSHRVSLGKTFPNLQFLTRTMRDEQTMTLYVCAPTNEETPPTDE